MRKIGASYAIVIALAVILCFSIISAQGNSSNVSASNSNASSSSDKIKKGFACLESKAGDCSSLSIQELALTILSTPAVDTYNKCVNVLKGKKTGSNFGSVRDTALAVLALDHAGVDTADVESWLLNKTLSPSDLTWFLEQDSDGATSCQISYDAKDYNVDIGEDKKISKDAGTCLKRAQSNYWFSITPSCYGKEIYITCDKDSKIAFLYKNKNSPTLYVLEGLATIPAASSPAKISVRSKCFGSSSCEYEGSVWATLALLKTGHDIQEFVPYIVAMADSNKRFLPDAFLYIITGYEDYANRLIESQKLGSYWQADGTAYNKIYDSSLALLSIGKSSSEKVVQGRNKLLFSQDDNGCWSNSNVRDTAFVLWALEGRPPRAVGPGNTSVTTCSSAKFFCLPQSECATEDDVSNNYFCSSPSTVCCKQKILKTCAEYQGIVCESGKQCSGLTKEASDTTACCSGTCEVPPTITECESSSWTCMEACGSLEQKNYACSGTQVCCGAPAPGQPKEKSSLWIWLLVIGIIIVLAAIIYIKREAIKLMLFKSKSQYKEDKGPAFGPPGYPPRGPPPSMPPRPMPARPMPPRPTPMQRGPAQAPQRMPSRPQAPARKDKDMSETFRKLQEISK